MFMILSSTISDLSLILSNVFLVHTFQFSFLEVSFGSFKNIFFIYVFSHSVMSDSLRPHGLYPSRLLCPRGFSRQEYWSGLPCPPPGYLPNPRIEPGSPALQIISRWATKEALYICYQFSHSVVSDSSWTAAHQASLSITNSWSLLKLMSIESVVSSNHLILCHPLLFLPSIFPSIRVFSNESVVCIRWSKCWSFSISPSNEYSGLISYRMDWFDLAVQMTLNSLLQHHSSKASILWHLAFFIVQLSHLNMTTGKTIALTRRTFVGKVMSLLFSMLSRLVIPFLPRSKHLLIS